MSDQNTDTTMKRSCSLIPLLPTGKTRPLCDDRSFQSLYLSTPFYDLQASDDETDVVNSESAGSENRRRCRGPNSEFLEQDEALELANLTAQRKGSLNQDPTGPIRVVSVHFELLRTRVWCIDT